MAHRRRTAGTDPLGPAFVTAFLFTQPLLEVVEQLVDALSLKLLLINTHCGGGPLWIFQPFIKHRLGPEIEFLILLVGKFSAVKLMAKYLVVAVEILLALDQHGPGRHIEVFDRIDQASINSPVQGEKGGGADWNPGLLKLIEEGDKHLI